MSYCKQCGTPINEGHNYCQNCGTKVDFDNLDYELKEKQLENEKKKSGCMTLLTGAFVSAVLLFTAGPTFAGIVFLIWIAIYLIEQIKK